MNMTINERFSKLMESLNKNPNSFAKALGKGWTSIDSICKGKTKPSFDLLESLFKTYPKVNPDWLINGNGSMFRDTPEIAVQPAPSVEPGDGYLKDHLHQLEESFSRLSQQLEKKDEQLGRKDEQLEKKDEQIAGLQRMLEAALGKSKRGPFSGIWFNQTKEEEEAVA